MPLQLTPVFTEQWFSPLSPADILLRLGYRTAPGQLTTVAGAITFQSYRYTDMHYFVGTLGVDCFTLQTLGQMRGQGRFVGFDTAWRTTVQGQLLAAGDGTRLALRYGLSSVALPLVAVGLLGWFGQQVSAEGLAPALLHLGLVAVVGGLVLWGVFRLAVRGLQNRLTELLLLRANPATT